MGWALERPSAVRYPRARMDSLLDPALALFVAGTIVANGLLFLLSGGALHYAFYVRRADTAAQWRIQPARPMPTRDDLATKLRFVLPSLVIFNGVLGAAFWAIATGRSQVVFDTTKYGATTLVVTGVLQPFVFHVLAFISHRLYHTPWLLRHVHTVHHRANAPVFIDGLALHPVEAVTTALVLAAPAFVMPNHVIAFGTYFFVVGIHELFDHSGIRLKMPLLSASEHHDEHHRRVSRCYAQTFTFLDDWFGTGMPS